MVINMAPVIADHAVIKSKRLPEDDLAEALKGNDSKKQRTENATLCEQCETIDFLSFFGPPPYRMKRLAKLDIFRTTDCPFCRFMSNEIIKGGFDPDLAKTKPPKFWLSLSRKALRPDEYLLPPRYSKV